MRFWFESTGVSIVSVANGNYLAEWPISGIQYEWITVLAGPQLPD